MGDGHVAKKNNRRNCSLRCTHSYKQKAYAEWKAALVHSIIGGSAIKVVEINNNGYPGVRWEKGFAYARILRKRLYTANGKDISKHIHRLDAQGLAILYMDDGGLSMKKRNGKIHSRELFLNLHGSLDYVVSIASGISTVFNVRFSPVKNKGKYRLRCGVAEAKKFLSIVSPFIHPSMTYKIDMRYGDERDDFQKARAPGPRNG